MEGAALKSIGAGSRLISPHGRRGEATVLAGRQGVRTIFVYAVRRSKVKERSGGSMTIVYTRSLSLGRPSINPSSNPFSQHSDETNALFQIQSRPLHGVPLASGQKTDSESDRFGGSHCTDSRFRLTLSPLDGALDGVREDVLEPRPEDLASCPVVTFSTALSMTVRACSASPPEAVRVG